MEVGNINFHESMILDDESMLQFIDESTEYEQNLTEFNQNHENQSQIHGEQGQLITLPDSNEVGEQNEAALSYIPQPIETADIADITGCLVGCIAKTWEELYDLYKSHANALGFSTKKTSGYISKKTNKASEKIFTCSCEGQSRAKEIQIDVPKPVELGETVFPSPVNTTSDPPKKKIRTKQTFIRRTGCLAKMRVKYINEKDMYIVASHNVDHNHQMTRVEWKHFKRSERSITGEKAEVIEKLEKAGVRPIDGYNVLAMSAGGEENLGYTRKDHANFVTNLRMKQIEEGDCQTLIERLIKLDEQNKGFFFRIKFDSEARLSAIFWRDKMMSEDFKLFGDVVSFDTTYRTNKYNLICAPIVGVNNHWQTVMFGCAFIANETAETFAWVLSTFKLSMAEKEPETIFTDQDQAMANAIEKVFQGRTRHRLYLWHILQNAVSYFGLLKTDDDFKKEFKHCLMGCYDFDEFEESWKALLEKYEISEHSWFKRLYSIKEKWCTGLNRHFFSAGILSSQRSESTNRAVSFKADGHTTLTKFYGLFNETIKRWRTKEQEMEFRAESTKTKPVLYGSLIKHAAEVYTPEIFKFFENEVKTSHATFHNIACQIDANNVMYTIGHEEIRKGKYEIVHFTRTGDNITVQYTCNHFTVVGWLCFHCLKALDLANVKRIPEQYISKRWTKEDKREVWDREYQGITEITTQKTEHYPWKQNMARKFYDLMSACEEHSDSRKYLEDTFNNASQVIWQMITTTDDGPTLSDVSSTVGSTKSAPLVRDPLCTKTKGRTKKPLTKFQRKKPITDEFGSKTPNVHLI